MTNGEIVEELRALIVAAAPDPAQAAPVQTCRADALLDDLIPFSSVIVLGVVIAVEDRFGIRVSRRAFLDACAGGATLDGLASMITKLQAPAP